MTQQQDYNNKLVADFRASRASRGQADDPFADRPLLVLTTLGAKSGQRRTTPLMYIPEGDNLLILASNAGSPHHPDWYYNILAHPTVTVETGNETFEANTTILKGEERESRLKGIIEKYPFFADHQAKITREIPLVLLTRQK